MRGVLFNPSDGSIRIKNMENIRNEIKEIRQIAKDEKVSMSFVLNVKKLLEQKQSNVLFKNANVIVDGYPSALEKIAINTKNL